MNNNILPIGTAVMMSFYRYVNHHPVYNNDEEITPFSNPLYYVVEYEKQPFPGQVLGVISGIKYRYTGKYSRGHNEEDNTFRFVANECKKIMLYQVRLSMTGRPFEIFRSDISRIAYTPPTQFLPVAGNGSLSNLKRLDSQTRQK